MLPFKSLLNYAWLGALLLFPIVLWLMPAGFFDSEDGIILCPSRALFGLECLGCGMTRAIMHLHHFEVEEALYYNVLSPAVYLGLIILWVVWVRAAWRTVKARRATDRMAPQA